MVGSTMSLRWRVHLLSMTKLWYILTVFMMQLKSLSTIICFSFRSESITSSSTICFSQTRYKGIHVWHLLLQVTWCDFIIWTPMALGTHVKRIGFDAKHYKLKLFSELARHTRHDRTKYQRAFRTLISCNNSILNVQP